MLRLAIPRAGGGNVDIHFACTQCGKCCQNLRLPLTIDEAKSWLAAGHDLQLLYEASPWPVEPEADDLPALYKRRHSFGGMSGLLPLRVTVYLTANLAGRCTHLQSDMTCAIYDRRPLVCRIYPAEINPFTRLATTSKLCPPEAWEPINPLLQTAALLVPADVLTAVLRAREANVADAPVKHKLSAALGFDRAAVLGEGFVLYSPDRQALTAALSWATASAEDQVDIRSWRLVSPRQTTLDGLASSGALVEQPPNVTAAPYEYVGTGTH
jgi:Fe-S-cluster containining protein